MLFWNFLKGAGQLGQSSDCHGAVASDAHSPLGWHLSESAIHLRVVEVDPQNTHLFDRRESFLTCTHLDWKLNIVRAGL